MLNGIWPWNTTACVGWDYTLALTGLCVTLALVGTVNRARRLLQDYYVDDGWPGMVHRSERGPGTVCGCGHHLAVHDKRTGRCCHGIGLDRLALLLALPFPPLVRDMLQEAGCSCRREVHRP
ncbi:hypothetical protein [Nocardiopsis sp. CNT312]|uniref:hypothetical protein n=1 Tax=Nocardiopsis sp. CNT312 TaxID=1137268 RepID=UPI0004B23162|nr:hypothetical protein [Nocardiopsis sp. CNT312]